MHSRNPDHNEDQFVLCIVTVPSEKKQINIYKISIMFEGTNWPLKQNLFMTSYLHNSLCSYKFCTMQNKNGKGNHGLSKTNICSPSKNKHT